MLIRAVEDFHSKGLPDRAFQALLEIEPLIHEVATLINASSIVRRRGLVGGALPKVLGRPLALRMLAYKLQAERLGDLDRVSRSELAVALSSKTSHDITEAGQSIGSSNGSSRPSCRKPESQAARALRPGLES